MTLVRLLPNTEYSGVKYTTPNVSVLLGLALFIVLVSNGYDMCTSMNTGMGMGMGRVGGHSKYMKLYNIDENSHVRHPHTDPK